MDAPRSLSLLQFKDGHLSDQWALLKGWAQGQSDQAKLRLEWIIFYYTVGQRSATDTANHFGISRKTFHKWFHRFDDRELSTLEDQPRAPRKKRPDNGSEFAGKFETACGTLKIEQVYSRVRQPKDNPALERFNRTVQDEWLDFSEVGLDEIDQANQDLTEWLVEYNSHRPHEALDYQTPLAYAEENYFRKVLPMYSASTAP